MWRERLILDDGEKSLDDEEKASDDKRVLRDKKSCVGWRIHDAQQACQGDRGLPPQLIPPAKQLLL